MLLIFFFLYRTSLCVYVSNIYDFRTAFFTALEIKSITPIVYYHANDADSCNTLGNNLFMKVPISIPISQKNANTKQTQCYYEILTPRQLTSNFFPHYRNSLTRFQFATVCCLFSTWYLSGSSLSCSLGVGIVKESIEIKRQSTLYVFICKLHAKMSKGTKPNSRHQNRRHVASAAVSQMIARIGSCFRFPMRQAKSQYLHRLFTCTSLLVTIESKPLLVRDKFRYLLYLLAVFAGLATVRHYMGASSSHEMDPPAIVQPLKEHTATVSKYVIVIVCLVFTVCISLLYC